MPERPPPSTSTFDFAGLPVRSGFCPAEPAIRSHDVSVLNTSDDPPTAPNCSRKRRRVRAGGDNGLHLLMDLRVLRNGSAEKPPPTGFKFGSRSALIGMRRGI